MVKKKGKSKRVTLKDKYKIQRRVLETKRKRGKQVKRDAKAGKIAHKAKKDPGIPNSWPFKQDLLKEIQRTRERQQQQENERKDKRRAELQQLKEHQAQGGTARTVKELMEQAKMDQASFDQKQPATANNNNNNDRSDGAVAAGQQSRRAYLRDLKKVVDSADVLLQVLDARDPLGSRIHTTIEDAILSRANKRMVLVLNKIDLVPKPVVGQWLTTLRKSHPTIAIKASHEKSNNASAQESADTSTVPVGMDGLLQLLKNYARTGAMGGKSKTTIVVGIVGYPNVGKSSIINALKRCRAVGVSSRPGSTASLQEVVLDRNVRLLDSPGVVFDDEASSTLGCFDANSSVDPIPPVQAILQRCDHASLCMTYSIPNFPSGDVMMFLAMVARAHGRVLKGGIPDKVAAARTVLRDWNSGKIPYYTPPPDESMETENGKSKHASAVIVSQLGDELDLSKFDDEVMKSLDDRDELDFVKIREDRHEESGMMAVEKAVKFLKGQADDDDEEDEDMDVEDGNAGQGKLAEAEDYDFDEM